MDKTLEILKLIYSYKPYLIQTTQIVAYVIAIASVIVKLTPTIKDDNILKKIIKFIGKFLAIDKYGPEGE